MKRIAFLLGMMALCACSSRNVKLLPSSAFETVIDGSKTSLYTIRGGDLTVQMTNYGARIVSLWAPDREDALADIAPGYSSIDNYIDNPGERFLGCVVGPVCNRVCRGRFSIGEESYTLPINNDPNTLHGGMKGLDRLVWNVDVLTDSSIVFSVEHPDSLDGWPGNLEILAEFTLTSQNELVVEYLARTDRPTPVNLSNHTFFNLTGNSDNSILGHELQILASAFTPVGKDLIPTGEIAPVEGTPFDFRQPKTIGQDVGADNVQLHNCGGYDHNWCLDTDPDSGVQLAARVYEPVSGRIMEVYTDQPGLQFYCGNFFDGKGIDKYGKPINYRCAFVMETQNFPDAVNQPSFQDIILAPEHTYSHKCIYKFGTRQE